MAIYYATRYRNKTSEDLSSTVHVSDSTSTYCNDKINWRGHCA